MARRRSYLRVQGVSLVCSFLFQAAWRLVQVEIGKLDLTIFDESVEPSFAGIHQAALLFNVGPGHAFYFGYRLRPMPDVLFDDLMLALPGFRGAEVRGKLDGP